MGNRSARSLFLTPHSVVFIGVPRRSGPGALNPVDNLHNWGYQGEIKLVHPHVREIAGLPVAPSVADVNGSAELAVISAPREATPSIVRACGEKGIRAVIVTNQGFAEADSRGKELQQAMVDEAERFGIRIIGPNTLGISNVFHGFNTSFMPLERTEVPTGVVAQSGVLFVGADQLIGAMGVGVDLGNACDVSITESLRWLGEDDRLRVIALYAEEISDGRDFVAAAEQITRRIPIVAMKTGRSEAGARAAASHSGSMTGNDDIISAAFRKAGVIRAEETEDLADLVRAFALLPAMRGRRVAVVTLTGAGGIIVLDALQKHGLQPARLSSVALEGIQRLSPDWMPLTNPVDIWPAVMKHGMQTAYGTALRGVLTDPNVDAAICIALGLGEAEQEHLGAEAVIAELAEEFPKPVIVWFYGSHGGETAARFTVTARALTVPSPERAARVLAAMASYEERRTRE